MNNELVTTEALEGEYIAAGEPEHTFTAQDPISESMRDAIRRQAEGIRNAGMGGLQGLGQKQGSALNGLGDIGSIGASLFGFR